MAAVEPIPEDLKGIIAYLVVSDARKAVEYYQKAMGAELLGTFDAPDGRVAHGELKIGENIFYLSDDFPEMGDGKSSTPEALGGTAVSMHLYVEDTDAAIERAVSAGATVAMPAEDMFWGDRHGRIVDPFGHTWGFSTHIKDVSEQEMAEASKAMFEQMGQ